MIVHEVITTEKVPLRFRVAGINSRLLAWLADLGMIALLLVMGAMLASALELGRAGLGSALMSLWVFGLLFGYFLLFEWLWHGQTPGKRLVGIRVINWQGTGISFTQAAVRNLYRLVDAVPIPVPFLLYGPAFVVAACNRENRRLGDLAAGTLVVHVESKARPVQALQEGVAGLDRAREALLRQRLNQLDRQQKQTLLDICMRRDQLGVGDRARLFRALGEYCQTQLGLTPEEYQSDEKFVLQLAAVLSFAGRVEQSPS
jgi:uncharacterized RDD family membrane protein YckC